MGDEGKDGNAWASSQHPKQIVSSAQMHVASLLHAQMPHPILTATAGVNSPGLELVAGLLGRRSPDHSGLATPRLVRTARWHLEAARCCRGRCWILS